MFSWPTRERLKTYLVQTVLLSVLFVSVYGSANWYGSNVREPFQLWFPFELEIPLIPEFILIYLSLNVLTILPLFTLTSEQLKKMGQVMAATIAIAGIFFYLIPAPLGYVRPSEIPRFNSLFQFLYSVDNVANTFPSLHIGLSFISARILVNENKSLVWLWLWFFIIALSVLFIHQHHLVDIFGGMILAEMNCRKFYFKDRYKSSSQSHPTVSAVKAPLQE